MKTNVFLTSVAALTLVACAPAGAVGDSCSADADCEEGLHCHVEEHDDHADEEEHDDHADEEGMCEEEEAHDDDHDDEAHDDE